MAVAPVFNNLLSKVDFANFQMGIYRNQPNAKNAHLCATAATVQLF
jgi:hypothetical protein